MLPRKKNRKKTSVGVDLRQLFLKNPPELNAIKNSHSILKQLPPVEIDKAHKMINFTLNEHPLNFSLFLFSISPHSNIGECISLDTSGNKR